MSLTKFLRKIGSINPEVIYVENVRSVLNVSTFNAKVICESAVAENLLLKKIGVICPNDGRIIESFDSVEEIPLTITCDICELDEIEPCTFNTVNLQKIEYYQLNK